MAETVEFHAARSLVRRHWRTYLLVAACAAVLSAVFSGPAFLTPRYRSEAVVYPVNLNSYSVETHADQLLQLLQSNAIRDSVIARFGLAGHYGVDTGKAGGRAVLNDIWHERVQIEKTRYESVELRVEDEDPRTARDLVAEVLHQGDLLARRLQRGNTAELLTVSRNTLERTARQLDSVEARLNTLRAANGLLDYEAQAKELTKGYVRALTERDAGAKAEVRGMLQALEEKGGEFSRLMALGKVLQKQYGKQQAVVQQQTMDLDRELTYTDLVVRPEVTDKKIWPVRWVLVAASTLAALVLCHVLLLLRAGGPASAEVKP
jgi:capsule polysaccharide export protein KpsE/RkpR